MKFKLTPALMRDIEGFLAARFISVKSSCPGLIEVSVGGSLPTIINKWLADNGFPRQRCGQCENCQCIERMKKSVLSPDYSQGRILPSGQLQPGIPRHADVDDAVEVWNQSLLDCPCSTWKEQDEDDPTLEIWDNDGKTADRYTIFFDESDDCVGSSSSPFHPQGFWQHTSGQRGEHLGKRVEFEQLPDDVQRAIRQELEP